MEADGENPREEIELDLGLSTNGRFGVDPTRAEKLTRSSSTANLALAFAGGGFEPHAPPLWRTRSLPSLAEEEECRRRKELQAISRMEARKKRMGKLRNSRVPRAKENGSCGKKRSHEGANGNFTSRRVTDVSTPRRFENVDLVESSQGSIGPPMPGSSGSSDPIEGLKPKQVTVISTPSHEKEPSTDQVGDAKVTTIKPPKNPMLHMPLVTTKDIGPNSHKVEGFLYGYKRGEDVRIVCVCHGTFLTPKEFVEHGGGANVEHPLKHIVVNPFPLS